MALPLLLASSFLLLFLAFQSGACLGPIEASALELVRSLYPGHACFCSYLLRTEINAYITIPPKIPGATLRVYPARLYIIVRVFPAESYTRFRQKYPARFRQNTRRNSAKDARGFIRQNRILIVRVFGGFVQYVSAKNTRC